MNKLILILTFLLTQSVFAIGWSSIGGEIYKDKNNPWFLENTERVYYCVDHDPVHFPIPSEVAKKVVREALQDWQDAFRLAAELDAFSDDGVEPYGTIRLATQEFIERSCEPSHVHGKNSLMGETIPEKLDLRFQLGRLTKSQQLGFKNPQDYVGVAVRTSYSKEKLKGQGFIYISPSSGPLKPELEAMDAEAWTYGDYFALKIVLRHEIGHLFGIVHGDDSLMGEATPELVVKSEFVKLIKEEYKKNFEDYFSPKRYLGIETSFNKEGCGSRNPIFELRLFDIESDQWEKFCGKILLEDQNLKIYIKENIEGLEFREVASARMNGSSSSSRPAVNLYLPKEQKVFTKIPEYLSIFNSIGISSLVRERHYSGRLFIDGRSKSYLMRITINGEEGSALIIDGDQFINDAFIVQ